MSTSFLHGIEVTETSDGSRPIRTATSSVIGLIGTAPRADVAAYPINAPLRISEGSKTAIKLLGESGTLVSAIKGIFDQIGATIVVIRVEEGTNTSETQTNIIGNNTERTGIWAFTGAVSKLGVQPRILIAPGFTNAIAVTTELISVANRLRAIVVADGPNTSDAEAIKFAENFGSDRLYIVDPQVQVIQGGIIVNEPASARVAGVIAKNDNDYGFWRSPSNQETSGIVGISRPIDFALNDRNTSANLLNEKNVATIIRQKGFRLWGNRTTSSDPNYAFVSVRRTADMICESILETHLWAVDRNITKTYLSDVTEGVIQYLRSLQYQGAIIGGTCWDDPDLNTPMNIADGKAHFNFDFAPPYPAEQITFRARINKEYLSEIIKK